MKPYDKLIGTHYLVTFATGTASMWTERVGCKM